MNFKSWHLLSTTVHILKQWSSIFLQNIIQTLLAFQYNPKETVKSTFSMPDLKQSS